MDFSDQDDLESGENVNNPDLEAFDAFNDVRVHHMFFTNSVITNLQKIRNCRLF